MSRKAKGKQKNIKKGHEIVDNAAVYPKPNCVVRVDTKLEWSDTCRRSTPNERYADYLGSNLRADMVFHVVRDNFKIPAHRLIIGAASPVLETIAYGTGDIAGSIDEAVPVRDCSSDEFYEVLRFVYTNIVNLTSSNATTILLLAHYYDLQSLEAECATFVLRTLTWQNVCDTYGKIYLMDNALTKECLRVIQNHTCRLFTAEQNLFDLELAPLSEVFKLDSLLIRNEIDLFAELLKWGQAQCDVPITDDGKHLRDALDGRIDFVRFAAMTPVQFAECVKMVGTRFFTNDEISATLQRIVRSQDCSAEESATIRLSYYATSRAVTGKEMILSISKGSYAAILMDSFKIECNRSISLDGFDGLPTNVAFTVTCGDPGNRYHHGHITNSISVAYKMYGQHAMFITPIIITSQKCFTIKYAEAVKDQYVLTSPISSNGITLAKMHPNYDSYNYGAHSTQTTFSKMLFSEVN